MTYKLTSGWPQHIESGAFVNPETNTAYLAWLAEGNTPEAADQPDPKDAIKAQIAALEAKVTPRRLREALLGGSMVFIHDVEDQIAALRAQL